MESLSDSEKHESSDVHMAFVCPGEPAGTKGLAWGERVVACLPEEGERPSWVAGGAWVATGGLVVEGISEAQTRYMVRNGIEP